MIVVMFGNQLSYLLCILFTSYNRLHRVLSFKNCLAYNTLSKHIMQVSLMCLTFPCYECGGSADSKSREESAKLLGCLINACEKLMGPYIVPVLHVSILLTTVCFLSTLAVSSSVSRLVNV